MQVHPQVAQEPLTVTIACLLDELTYTATMLDLAILAGGNKFKMQRSHDDFQNSLAGLDDVPKYTAKLFEDCNM